MTRQLVVRWRARLGALREHGWVSRPKQPYDTFVRNCCPTFVFSYPRQRPCHLDYVCPFCYARWVRKIWLQINEAFPNPRLALPEGAIQRYAARSTQVLTRGIPAQEQYVPATVEHEGRPLRTIRLDEAAPQCEPVDYPYHMIVHTATITMPYLPTDPTLLAGYGTYELYARYLLEQLARLRRLDMPRIMRPAGMRGALFHTTLEPSADGWRIKYRQLFMVQSAYVPNIPTNGYFRRVTQPTRREIFHAVTRVCQYPTQLLKGDACMTAALLCARQPRASEDQVFRSPRLRALCGAFRRRKS